MIDPASPVNVIYNNHSVTLTPGETISIPRSDADEIMLQNEGGTEELRLHTSCSQPLLTGDVYGSLTLVALEDTGLGRDISYHYRVENTGLNEIQAISITDDILGSIANGITLTPGETRTFIHTSYIAESVTNLATASGIDSSNRSCTATDTSTVTVIPPPSCTVGVLFEKLEDDKIKFKLTNSSAVPITLASLSFSFPEGYGEIKEIKLDGAIFKRSESTLQTPSGTTVSESDWTQSDITKRVLESGETRTLEIVFMNKQEKELFQESVTSYFSGLAEFAEGCSATL
ncbi:MAG: hypothetical protein R3208_22085 [Ketobacteraceae bacterium]|nr:hypothetical protein [Ketobacteraceae bacterium]